MTLASFHQVSRRYPTGHGVKNLSFSLHADQKVGLLGLNGSGKTTTIKLLAGLLIPDRGQITVAGKPPRQVRGSVSYLSDKPSFEPWMRLADIQRFMSALYPDYRLEVFAKLSDRLKVPDQSMNSMSKGQQQRLRLAACLARKVSLYLLDEPLSGIDVVSREMILELLWDNREPSSCFLISTHEIKEIEKLLDRALILKDGELVLDQLSGTKTDEASSFTRHFIELHR